MTVHALICHAGLPGRIIVDAMIRLRSTSPAATHAIAAAVASLTRAGDVIVLAGEMGAGKTAFAQGFGAALGIVEQITSPTFTLVHSYPLGKITFHHADLYRLSTQHEVADLALAELAEDGGILLVEWGDVVESSLGEHLTIHLDHALDAVGGTETDPAGEADPSLDTVRLLQVHGVGRSWAARWDLLVAKLAPFAVDGAA